jgi:Protein of unknown function (DUF2752)
MRFMQVAVAATTGWKQRVAPIVCGCALAGAAAVVALNDPAAAGSRFPACLFHSTTGLWCPGCGLTRGFHQLFNGNLGSALSYNLFVPFVLVAVVVSWLGWTLGAFGRPVPWRHRVVGGRWLTVGVPAVLLLYGVVRNIPAAPFRALAP